MSRRRRAECKLWFDWDGEEFYGLFDQYFYLQPAEPDVGIENPYCELDGYEDLHFYDDEDTLIDMNHPDYHDFKEQFAIRYDNQSGEDCVINQCWDSQRDDQWE